MPAAVAFRSHVSRLHAVLATLIVALGFLEFSPAATAAEQTRTYTIPAQDLGSALKAYALQSQREIFFPPDLARGRRTNGISGQYEDLAALTAVLADTGLTYTLTDSNAILVRDSTRASTENSANLEEVLVTAQKRTERLLEVPVPVSAVTGSELRDTNKLRLAEYFTQVPGLLYTTAAVGDAVTVSIRGLASGGGGVNPTVGFTIDDVPFGSARSDGGSYAIPEIDPGDLERMEVLRGPQGTLYGASSLGGLIKYVTVDPSLDRMKGQLSVGMNSIKNESDPGYRVYGSINLPVADTLAIRGSAFTRRSPGYIENPVRGIKGIGEVQAKGGRLTGLWEPSDVFSLKLSAFYQESEQDGAVRVVNPTSPYRADLGLPALGNFQQDDLPGTGLTEKTLHGFNATMRASFGDVEVMSISGYNVTDLRSSTDDNSDWVSWYIPFTEFFIGPEVPDNSTHHSFDAGHDLKKFAQELRLSVPFGGRFTALFGLFYTDEDYAGNFISHLVNPDTLQDAALRDIAQVSFGYKEWAGFANLTVKFTDQFDMQFGARRSRNEGVYQGINKGPQIGGVPLGEPRIGDVFRNSEYVSTYLVTPRYRITDDYMVYARAATGYRPGGFNPLNQIGEPYPPYDSDTSKNYEVGFKGILFDGRLTVDASVYRIDWDDIQVQATDETSTFLYFENGSSARSQGVELSLSVRPLRGLELSGWVALGNAELTEDFPPSATVAGRKGDRLPLSGEVSGSFSVTQEFALFNAWTGYVGGTFTLTDDHLGNFSGFEPRDRNEGYQTVDLRAGVHNDLWTVGLYVANVANERGFVSGGEDYLVPIKPRELGLNISRSF